MGTKGKVSDSATVDVQRSVKKMDPRGYLLKLGPGPQERFRGLLMAMAYHGYGRVVVTSSLRSIEQQCRLYGQGRMIGALEQLGVPGRYSDPAEPIVTWVLPTKSRHVHGMAIDLDVSAYSRWDDHIVGNLCKHLGITWGGLFDKRDYGHFELPKFDEGVR